jgi:hypothetical protein
MSDSSDSLCERLCVAAAPPSLDSKVGIALRTLHLRPLNGLRHLPSGDTCGWYIWGGEVLGDADDFFEALHVSHLPERCAEVVKYLDLPAGWRFLVAPGHEDVWFDPKLLVE